MVGGVRSRWRLRSGGVALHSLVLAFSHAGCSAAKQETPAVVLGPARPLATPAATVEEDPSRRQTVIMVSVGPRQYPAMIVAGADAIETSRRLRASAPQTIQYPIIVGEFGRAVEYLESVQFSASPAELLRRAEEVELTPANWRREAPRPNPSNPKLDALFDRMSEFQANERRRVFEATQIPSGGVPPTQFVAHRNMLKDVPFEKVLIVLVPSHVGWQAPAYLGFGGFGHCPRPEEHARLLHHWYDLYGAELVSLGADSLELEVPHPPTSPREALELAKVQYDYCPDVAAQKDTSLGSMAASLLQQNIWYFWWD